MPPAVPSIVPDRDGTSKKKQTGKTGLMDPVAAEYRGSDFDKNGVVDDNDLDLILNQWGVTDPE